MSTKKVTLDWLTLCPTDTIHYDPECDVWRNPARADRVISFIEALTVPSGVGAGRSMALRDWQKQFLRDIYEPCYESGMRVVSEAVLSVGRKNGKTAKIAALVLVHLVGPEATINGEVYSAANDKEQAGIVFKFAAQFVRADTELDHEQGGVLKLVDSTKHIACYGNGSFYKALSRDSKTKHGLNPTFAIYDELAQSLDRDLYDTLNTADGAREEFLFVTIGTQSRDPQNILSELIDRGLKGDDPAVVVHLYAVPDETAEDVYCEACEVRAKASKDKRQRCSKCGGKTVAGFYDPSLWSLANPALGDFKLLEKMHRKARQAMDMPSFEPAFRNLELNQRVDLVPSLISRSEWESCYVPDVRLRDGEEIYLGLDLAATTDLCALVAVSAEDADRCAAWFWKPRDFVALHEKRDRAPYERWITEGHLFAAPGRDVDYDLIANHFDVLSERYRIVGTAYDRWRMDVLMKCFTRLEIEAYIDTDDAVDSDGIRFVPWGQGYKDMGPAVDALEKSVSSRTLAHNGHPVLTWCVSNAVAATDPAGNKKLDKSKARFRIDGAVALTMALGLKARDKEQDEGDFDGFLSNPISAAVG